jgi:hypothetical protein
MVKLVRNFYFNLCFVISAALLIASDADAQQTRPRRNPVRSSEQAARQSWTPLRNVPTEETVDAESRKKSARVVTGTAQRRAANSKATKQRSSSVRQAAAQVEIPTPVPDSVVSSPGTTILEGPVEQVPMDGYIDHGHVEYAPVHDAGCDGMPGCGCDPCAGYGACSVAGCSTCGELVSPQAWRPCVTLRLPQDGWISYEFLGWWQDGMYLPPLVSTSSDPQVPVQDAGVLGEPTTQVLFGGRRVLDDGIDGSRLRFGIWLDRCHTWGLAAELFELSRESEGFRGTSTGDPILARPFFNTDIGNQDSELVAYPGILSGTVTASASGQFRGAGFHFKRLRCCDQGCRQWLFCSCPDHYCTRTERLVGYRYLELEEQVTITEDLVSTDPDQPGSFDIIDSFKVRNQFNGIDLGWNYRLTRGYWSFATRLRLALGITHQSVAINGRTTASDPIDGVRTGAGGLLTAVSNIGFYEQDEFAVVPEINFDGGYQLTDHLKFTLGYTFIYWSNVVRPGHIIDTDVNPLLLPETILSGARRPAFAFDTTDYWVQGINFGFEYRW